MNDLLEPSTKARSNIPEFSVSELAFSVKRTVEENFGRVRVRGELSRVSIPKSGHLYTSLKDDKAVIDAVCWKGVLAKLSIKPEEGLEVICTGKMTTYPGNSRYQLVIESMELAGEGALLKMLEERKKKLAAEGLFDPNRKKTLPFLPLKIGVVTSPTGAVIRDILHRLQDRFPRPVLVWPVKVQGEGAANEITAAINGFNALDNKHRPDLIIVARGGGSLEDLMPFNEENVVRAAAMSKIPIISAVGHETDTTLIDYAADVRAPTPTGAAEIAVPVRMNLMAQIADNEKRLFNGMSRFLSNFSHRLDAISAKLGDPSRLLELKIQHIDNASNRLDHSITNKIGNGQKKLADTGVHLLHPAQMLENKKLNFENLVNRTLQSYQHYLSKKVHLAQKHSSKLRTPNDRVKQESKNLEHVTDRLTRTETSLLYDKYQSCNHLCDKLEILSFENILNRGFTVVRDANGKPVTQGKDLKNNQAFTVQFKNQNYIDALVTNVTKASTDKPKIELTKEKLKATNKQEQGSLF